MTPDMSSMDWRGRIAVLEAERDALRAEVERLKAQAMAVPVSPQAWWELSDKLKKAEAALRDVRETIKRVLGGHTSIATVALSGAVDVIDAALRDTAPEVKP